MNVFIKSSLCLWIPLLLSAQSISEKKASLTEKSHAKEQDAVFLNQELGNLKKSLQHAYNQAQKLAKENSDPEAFRAVLAEVNEIKRKKDQLEESWRVSAVEEGMQDGEAYALWDQEEVTLSQLIMEYGSSDYLYIIPTEFAALKLHLHSNIPIPRQSWSDLLEMMLYHHGFGLKRLNPFAKQLYILKQDIGAVQTIAHRPEHVALAPPGSRVCYLLLPPVEQVKSAFQFFEKFSDNKQTFVHQLGNKIALVAMKEEVERLLDFYDKVWGSQPGKVTRVVSVSKIPVREMEKLLQHFFGESVDKARAPFAKVEQEVLGIFSIATSNSLVFIGSKESVDRAEKIVKDTEEQLEDPAEMTIHLYTCRHSDPTDLAHVLEKVYISLIHANQEGAPKETEVSYSSQIQGSKAPPEGYPPMPPLVVSPPPLKPGNQTKIDIEQGSSDHFIPDPKTGTILMTVRRDVLGKIKDLLKRLDIPKKMVQLEVLMFERRLKSQDNYGLNLLKLGKSKNGVTYLPTVGPHHKQGQLPGVLQFFFHGPSHKYTPHFDVAYNFLLTQDDIQLNAAPSVITVNQTPTTISIVEEISINNGAAPIDTNKGTSFEKSFARANYGIIINLTPTIHGPDEQGGLGSVTIQTDITFDTTKPHPDDRPMVDRRHIQNEVRVLDGETIILGGLRRKSRNDHEEKIYFFGDLPVIGKLFGTTQLTDHDTEMFFFITPKIIFDPKEEVEKIRTEELKKRPGDIPEFLVHVEEAYEKQKRKFFHDSLKTLFSNDR
jgi:general secretion pathway protein D